MKRIITISREFGAGGGEIGAELSQRLGYEFYHKELIFMAAAKLNMDVMSMIKWDEKVPLNFGFTQSLFDFYNKPLNEKLFKAQSEVIHRIGEKGRCVILGRNANTVLREFDGCLNVFICADLNWRSERMKSRMPDLTDAQRKNKIRAVDKARRKYCSFYTKDTFGSADCYDICLNSSRLGIEKCTDIIYRLAAEE